MSKMKKIAGLLLAVVMVVAMSAVAWADAPYTITIDNDADGYVYTAYQIFAGTLHEEYTQYTGTAAPTDGTLLYTEDSGVYTLFTGSFDPAATYYYVSSTTLSNITWGSGIDSDNTDLQYALTTAYGTTDAAEIAKKLTSTETAKEFAAIIDDYLTTGTASMDAGDTYTITVGAAGYYLIKNTTVPSGGSYTSYILEVVTNVEVDPKTSDTTIDKTVDDVNDSTGETSTGKSADYDIGDDVPFTLTATLPSNYADYTTYEMIFHDTLSTGLGFNNDVKVEVYVPTLGSTLGNWVSTTTYYTYDSSTKTFTVVDQSNPSTPESDVYYYVKYVVNTSDYTVVYKYAVANISNFNGSNTYSTTGTTKYYTYDGSTYTEVTDGATFDSDTVYYTQGTGCYHKVSITDFDGNAIYSTSGTTKYYTYDGSTYTEVSNGASFDSNTTYYVYDECSFEVQIYDTKTLEDESNNTIPVAYGSVITVTYTANLLTSASYMETNEVYVEFSNNPYNNGTGKTEPSKTTVFTFTLTVNKVDSSNNALEGAGFTLYKQVKITSSEYASGTYYIVDPTTKKITQEAAGSTYSDQTTYYIKVGDEVSGSGMTTFTWKGLDDGDYVLVETTTPNGYNTMDDSYFTIEAEYTGTEITSLTIKDKSGAVISGTNLQFTTSITGTEAGTISTNITNYKGSELPSTGGIGTTIFYVVGSILVVGAAVILITRKRMKSAR